MFQRISFRESYSHQRYMNCMSFPPDKLQYNLIFQLSPNLPCLIDLSKYIRYIRPNFM